MGKLPTHPAELPLRQLAHALVLARRDARLSGRDVARRLGVHLADLRAWEHGRARPGWEELDVLSELYGDHLADRLREREPVVLDLAAGVLRMGDRVAAFDPSSSDNEAVLRLYLRRVRELRGLRRGTRFPLRDDDITALALVVDLHDAALEDRLVALMGVDRTEAGALRHRLVAAAAVAVIGTGVAGVAFARAHDADAHPAVVAASAMADTGSPDRASPHVAATTTTSDAATSSRPTPSASTLDGSAFDDPAPGATATVPTPTAAVDTVDTTDAAAPVADTPAAPTATTVAASPVDASDDDVEPAPEPGVDDADVLASTTPPVPDVIDDPAEAFVDPPATPTDDAPPAPVSHDDPAEAFTG